MKIPFSIGPAVLLLHLGLVDAAAQRLGTYRWQLAPFCNIVTLDVERREAVFDILAVDDACGSGRRTPLRGTATPNPNGRLIDVGLSGIRFDGIPIATTLQIDAVTLGGGWTDEYGNSGTLLFNPPATVTGPVRSVSFKGAFGTNLWATGALQTSSAVFSFSRQLVVAMPGLGEDIIPPGGPSTANCPGSVDAPQAAPGHLCIYERVRTNALSVCVGSSSSCGLTERTGAAVHVVAAGAGLTRSAGTWALTLVP
jgi:hypothetical protein